MGNLGSTVAKVMVLAGGAVLGALLAEWVDRFITSQAQEKPDYDKERYAQGLGPLSSPPPTIIEESQN